MKKSLIALAVLGGAAGAAQAQSSVTLYGLVDVGLNYTSNVGGKRLYNTTSGVEQAKAEKDAKEDADGLAKGQYIPHVIEPSAGVDRLILALIANAYAEEDVPDEKGKIETRVVMRFHPRVAPIKVAVLPLLKNKPELVKAIAPFWSYTSEDGIPPIDSILGMQDYWADYFTFVEKKVPRAQLFELSVAEEAQRRLRTEKPFAN